MWFSSVYANPEKVKLPLRSHPRTLYDVLYYARQRTFGDAQDQRAWCTSQLITACRLQGLKVLGQSEIKEYWVVGRKSLGLNGFLPLWELARPPKLKMLECIKNRSLDELEDLMSGLSQGVDDIIQNASGANDNESGRESDNQNGNESSDSNSHIQPRSTRIGRDMEQRSSDSQRSILNEIASTVVTSSNGSVFVPSI